MDEHVGITINFFFLLTCWTLSIFVFRAPIFFFFNTPRTLALSYSYSLLLTPLFFSPLSSLYLT
ncbi:hypothetical protein F4809DRAFT_586103 [Biscogniauxia mediterranea]|nr:hypothetical protein F4809DRAFT_586103 [Biscogniauxia mediterranea]